MVANALQQLNTTLLPIFIDTGKISGTCEIVPIVSGRNIHMLTLHKVQYIATKKMQ